MVKRGTDYARLAAQVQFGLPDGGPTRPVHRWTVDKLAILAYYLPTFAKICSSRAGGWYYIDAFAGCGVNDVAGEYWYKGSGLIGAGTQPPAGLSLLVENDSGLAAALEDRTRPFGRRVRVEQGDSNVVLEPLLRKHLTNRKLPGFAVLDPEGLELNFETVAAVAAHRSPEYTPYELLVYFSTPGVARVGGVVGEGRAAAQARLSRLFGNDDWRSICERYEKGSLKPGEAGGLYRELYKEQIRRLGYAHVIERPVPGPSGRPIYHLILATNDPTGFKLLTTASQRAFLNNLPLPRPE